VVTFSPQRTTQPYRQGATRAPGSVLQAILAGRSLYGFNPQDQVREQQRRLRLSQLAAQQQRRY
jgi:hypothetical protein